MCVYSINSNKNRTLRPLSPQEPHIIDYVNLDYVGGRSISYNSSIDVERRIFFVSKQPGKALQSPLHHHKHTENIQTHQPDNLPAQRKASKFIRAGLS